ncbi:hypothetical protein ACEWY4_011236 [Coilia grayii]|uniref:F-box/LRR-repeat protein 15-like leucin rich repeat domain-containing protein n=1 Tax=Coilia grayii TaxID=363190 RepID=A0ABD1K481_9TELE
MTDASMKYIASLKSLSYLDISDSVRVSDVGLRFLMDGPSASKLQEFNLSNCRVSDFVVVRIVQRCSVLKTLNMAYCEALTETAFEFLCNLRSLVSLDISGCHIQDKMFCRRAKPLEDIDISHCVSLSDLSIKSLSFYCRALARLIMAGCPKMTDAAIQYLTLRDSNLKELDVSGCVLLTDRAPRALLKGCLNLRSLTMLYCRGISKRSALRLQPRLKHWEHSRDDAPCWYSYDLEDQLPQLSKKAKKQDITWEYEDSHRNSSTLTR